MASKAHKQLKEIAKTMLKAQGFSDEEIHTEWTIGQDIVDVVGLRTHFKIAIECGNTSCTKLGALAKTCQKVICLPYNTNAAFEVISLNLASIDLTTDDLRPNLEPNIEVKPNGLFHCLNCGYEWKPRKDKPKYCTGCKVPLRFPIPSKPNP